MFLEAAPLMEIEAWLGESLPLGNTLLGVCQQIPLTGGTFQGPGIQGRIVPGGADWNTVVDGGYIHFHARYSLMTDAGQILTIVNEGLTDADFGASFIKTRATFLVDRHGPWAHLLKGIHVGAVDVSRAAEQRVRISLFTLK